MTFSHHRVSKAKGIGRRVRPVFASMVFWLLAALPALAQANVMMENTLFLAGTGNPAVDQRVSDLLEKALSGTDATDNRPELTVLPFREDQARKAPSVPVVALGPEAVTRVLQESPESPILALLVNEGFYSALNAPSERISALFYDPPLARQALLGKTILPHATRIAVLARPENALRYDNQLAPLRDAGLEAQVFVVSSDDRLIPTLVRALGYGDFLLALPDDRIYNPRTIKHILLTAYRRSRIVIGPRQAYVKAGALASTYTPLTTLVREAAGYIRTHREKGAFPPAAYPLGYAIEVNRQVARSLNILLGDDQALEQQLQDNIRQLQEVAP